MARSPWSDVKSTTVLFNKPVSLRAAITSPAAEKCYQILVKDHTQCIQHSRSELVHEMLNPAYPACRLFRHTWHNNRPGCPWSPARKSCHCSFWWRWNNNQRGAFQKMATTSGGKPAPWKPLWNWDLGIIDMLKAGFYIMLHHIIF